eukprot:6309530-Prymnesium_polylepis.1
MDSFAEKSGFQCPAASEASEGGAAVAVPRRVKRSRSGLRDTAAFTGRSLSFLFERPARTHVNVQPAHLEEGTPDGGG